jgi:hypothetical protein
MLSTFNFWGLYPVASVTMTCFGGAVNRNNFYFLIPPFTSLHVLASTGHPQVKYTQSFLKAITPAMDPFLGYTVYIYIYIYILVLFVIMLCNILYLKSEIADKQNYNVSVLRLYSIYILFFLLYNILYLKFKIADKRNYNGSVLRLYSLYMYIRVYIYIFFFVSYYVI